MYNPLFLIHLDMAAKKNCTCANTRRCCKFGIACPVDLGGSCARQVVVVLFVETGEITNRECIGNFGLHLERSSGQTLFTD